MASEGIVSKDPSMEAYDILNKASMCLYHRYTFTYSADGAFDKAAYTVTSSFEAWYLKRCKRPPLRNKEGKNTLESVSKHSDVPSDITAGEKVFIKLL